LCLQRTHNSTTRQRTVYNRHNLCRNDPCDHVKILPKLDGRRIEPTMSSRFRWPWAIRREPRQGRSRSRYCRRSHVPFKALLTRSSRAHKAEHCAADGASWYLPRTQDQDLSIRKSSPRSFHRRLFSKYHQTSNIGVRKPSSPSFCRRPHIGA
jgi:hypothetical protein